MNYNCNNDSNLFGTIPSKHHPKIRTEKQRTTKKKTPRSSQTITNFKTHSITSTTDNVRSGTKIMFNCEFIFMLQCITFHRSTSLVYMLHVLIVYHTYSRTPPCLGTPVGIFIFESAISTLWTIHRVRSKAVFVRCVFVVCGIE